MVFSHTIRLFTLVVFAISSDFNAKILPCICKLYLGVASFGLGKLCESPYGMERFAFFAAFLFCISAVPCHCTNVPVVSGLIAHYTVDSWTGTQWTDLSGAQNHVTDIGGTAISVARPVGSPAYIFGARTAWFRFPMGVLPSSSFTLFFVARYNGPSYERTGDRIFQGVNQNMLFGFGGINSNNGADSYACESWITNYTSRSALKLGRQDWTLGTAQSDSYRYNGIIRTANPKSACIMFDRIAVNVGSNPCSKYLLTSTNVDTPCYQYVWYRAGCETYVVSGDWHKLQTLYGLIRDSFLWATLTDSDHRKVCYGASTDYSKAIEPDYNINSPNTADFAIQSVLVYNRTLPLPEVLEIESYLKQKHCPTGSYNPSFYLLKFSNCTLCPSKHFCPNSSISSPLPCTPGSICPSSGMNAAIPCSPGNVCPSNSLTAMTSCPVGSYCPSSGMTSPLPCPSGSICPSSGMKQSDPCPVGSYCPSSGMTSPLPCTPGSICPSIGLQSSSPCPSNTFAPSSGSAACTPCPSGHTSSSNSVSCEKCLPSALDPSTFSCYTPLQQGWIIFGYVMSVVSSIFSLYKLRIFVLERIEKLKEAGIKPSFKCILFLDRTLTNHSKHMLVSMSEQPSDTSEIESQNVVFEMVHEMQLRLKEQQQQHQQQIQQLKLQLQQLQQ